MSSTIAGDTSIVQTFVTDGNPVTESASHNSRFPSVVVSLSQVTDTAAQIDEGVRSDPMTGEPPTTAPPGASARKPRKKRESGLELPDSASDMTDAWHARRFVDRFGDRLRFCTVSKRWLEYDGRRWHKDNDLAAQRLAMEWVEFLRTYVGRVKKRADRDAFMEAVRRAESQRSIAATIRLAQSDERITVKPQDFDQGDDVLNCQNGTLDLKNGKLRPHAPDDKLTKLMPVNYTESAECPTWLRFLDRIMGGDQEMIAFLQRILGYSLTGSVKEECMFVFYGQGQNGKSKLLNTIRDIVGDYGGVSDSNTLTLKVRASHPTGIADLAGKRLVVISEPSECRFDEALVKSLTGGDGISSRKLYQDFSEFKPTHKIFLMSNHKPLVRELSEAYWRRMNLVEFAITIPPEERDNDLSTKLMAEAEGILAWMVRGCLEWQEKGLAQPTKVVEATKGYRDEMDKIGGFLESQCTYGPGLRVDSTELWLAYQAWCDQEGLSAMERIVSLQPVSAIGPGRDGNWPVLRYSRTAMETAETGLWPRCFSVRNTLIRMA